MTNNTDQATMRAISQDAYGTPDVLREVRLPKPVPGPSQVLVAVRAAGVNPTDWKHRANRLFLDRLPLVLGWDVSGVVEAVGYGVTLFKPGDEVFGMLPYPYGVGSHAEYVTAPARALSTNRPASITSRRAHFRSLPSPPTRHSSTPPKSVPGSASSSTPRPAA